MPQVRAAQRKAPVLPVQRVGPRQPVKQNRPVPQRILPVLQAPTFSDRSDFIFANRLTQNDVKPTYLPTVNPENTRKPTQQIPVQVPTYIPQQNYPKQPLPNIATRHTRYAEQKYSPHLYSNH